MARFHLFRKLAFGVLFLKSGSELGVDVQKMWPQQYAAGSLCSIKRLGDAEDFLMIWCGETVYSSALRYDKPHGTPHAMLVFTSLYRC